MAEVAMASEWQNGAATGGTGNGSSNGSNGHHTHGTENVEPSSSHWGDTVPPEVAEVAEKYDYTLSQDRSVQKEVIELKKHIRSKLTIQMKMKAGYSQMQRLYTRTSEQLKKDLREISEKIADMQDDLQVLDMYDIGAFDDDESHMDDASQSAAASLAADTTRDAQANGAATAMLQHTINGKLAALQKDMDVELAVKKGLENFMKIDPSNDRCRELLSTCKIKISMLEMEIGKIRHDIQASIDSGDTRSKTEILIDELLFRYRKELALKEGAMNMTKTLKAQKKTDQKGVNDATQTYIQAAEKADLIRMALLKYGDQLDQENPRRRALMDEIEESLLPLPLSSSPHHHTQHKFADRFSPPSSSPTTPLSESPSKSSSLPRSIHGRRLSILPPTLAVSGRLEVRIIGCQNLVSEVTDRGLRTEKLGVSASTALANDLANSTKTKGSNASKIGQRPARSNARRRQYNIGGWCGRHNSPEPKGLQPEGERSDRPGVETEITRDWRKTAKYVRSPTSTLPPPAPSFGRRSPKKLHRPASLPPNAVFDTTK